MIHEANIRTILRKRGIYPLGDSTTRASFPYILHIFTEKNHAHDQPANHEHDIKDATTLDNSNYSKNLLIT